MDNKELLSLYTSSGALLEGHFLLTSGRHSDKYFEKFKLLSQPEAVKSICTSIYNKFKINDVDLVVGAATGGIILAYEIGRQLGTKGVFAERVNGELIFRRGFVLEKRQRVLLVDDVLTTGGSLFELIKVTEFTGANIIGISVIFDRTGGEIEFDYPFHSVHSEKIKSWEQNNCPQCIQSVPITKRGSTGKNNNLNRRSK